MSEKLENFYNIIIKKGIKINNCFFSFLLFCFIMFEIEMFINEKYFFTVCFGQYSIDSDSMYFWLEYKDIDIYDFISPLYNNNKYIKFKKTENYYIYNYKIPLISLKIILYYILNYIDIKLYKKIIKFIKKNQIINNG